MSITLDLSPQDEARLTAAAEAEGVDRAAILQRLVRTHLPQPKAVLGAVPNAKNQRLIDTLRAWREEDAADAALAAIPDAENQRAIALLRAWREEDATDDEKELERRDVENAEVMRNLETNRLSLRIPNLDF